MPLMISQYLHSEPYPACKRREEKENEDDEGFRSEL
jgi:hypothetical protein